MNNIATLSEEEIPYIWPSMSPKELTELLHNPNLTVEFLAGILKRKDLTQDFLLEAVASPLGGKYIVRAALVMNPKLPKIEALNLVKFLFWRDLLKVNENPSLLPEVRKRAETELIGRMEEMALGELITLAKICSRDIIKVMRTQRNIKILEALLINSKLTEEDILFLINNSKTPAPVIETIGRSGKWGVRPEIRMAIILNEKSPVPVSLSFISSMTKQQLITLRNHPRLPKIIKVSIERLLV